MRTEIVHVGQVISTFCSMMLTPRVIFEFLSLFLGSRNYSCSLSFMFVIECLFRNGDGRWGVLRHRERSCRIVVYIVYSYA